MWHPFYGRKLFILERLRRLGTPVFWCALEPEPRRPRLEIPRWMFDAPYCSRMQLSDPRVCWRALAELTTLLHEITSAEPAAAVELQHRPKGGGADAEAHPTTASTGTLPAAKSSTIVERSSHRSTANRDSSTGQDLARAPRPVDPETKERRREP